MEYVEYDIPMHEQLVEHGYKYLVMGGPLTAEQVGREEESGTYQEVIPVKEQPADGIPYHAIDNPDEIVAIGGFDDIYCFINRKYDAL